MSGISDLNIVIQQGGGAKEAQGIRQGVHGQNHVVAAHQKEKDAQQQTTVQQSEQSDKSRLGKDKRDRRRRKRRQSAGGSAPHQPRGDDESGKLVDTIA